MYVKISIICIFGLVDISVEKQTLIEAYQFICSARSMSTLFEKNKIITAKYVHATSKGHEAFQIALGQQLKIMIMYFHIIETMPYC